MTRTWLLVLGALATVGFAVIVLVAIPSLMLVEVPRPPQLEPYTPEQARGRAVYIANGCIYCHTQQVRDPAFTSDVERGWGPRPSVPADYVYDRPNLLGTMRTGPDLLNVGSRLPDANWHLLHLYQPRAVVPWSIMPSFRFLFDVRHADFMGPEVRTLDVAGRFGRDHVPRRDRMPRGLRRRCAKCRRDDWLLRHRHDAR
jgi:cytochrome c oxidase cbb3-type subunit 2